MTWRSIGVAFLLSFFLAPQYVAGQNERSLFWEISGNGIPSPSYLYGTIHLICPEDFFLSESLKQSLGKSRQIALEIDMDDPDMMASMMAGMNMKDGGRLSNLLPVAAYKRVSDFFKDSLGINIAMFEGAKPFMLSSLIFSKAMACEPKSYEMTFVEMASKQKLEIVGLETIQEQMAVFDAIPYQTQAQTLLNMVDSIGLARKELKDLVAVYKQQDIEGLVRMTTESKFDMEGHEETLLYSRNRRWIPVMTDLMRSKPTFFAVGAAHLGGEQGVISLLRKYGYTVRPI